MKTILIVEDDRILNRGVSFALKKEGYEIISAYSLEEAKNVIIKNDIVTSALQKFTKRK